MTASTTYGMQPFFWNSVVWGIVFIETASLTILPFAIAQVCWKNKQDSVCEQALSSLEESYLNQAYN